MTDEDKQEEAPKPDTRTPHEKWDDEREAEAHAYVERVHKLWAKVKALPDDPEGLERQSLLAKIDDVLPLRVGTELNPAQHKAALLAGKGMPYSDVEKRLNLEPGDIILWHRDSADFRKALEYYKSLGEEEIGSRLLREVNVMLSKPDMPDETKLKVMGLMQKIGMQPHQRFMDRMNLRLRYEQVEVARDFVDFERGALPGVPSGIVIEGEFEVLDEDGDEKV